MITAMFVGASELYSSAVVVFDPRADSFFKAIIVALVFGFAVGMPCLGGWFGFVVVDLLFFVAIAVVCDVQTSPSGVLLHAIKL